MKGIIVFFEYGEYLRKLVVTWGEL